MATVIIAEKPDAAERLALALAEGKPKKKASNQGVSYYEFERNGKKHIVVAAVGHLFNLKQTGDKGWTYPVFDVEWMPSFKIRKQSAFSEKYFRTIEEVVKSNGKNCEYISAADFDNEGSTIAYNILRFICNANEAKRMKFSTLTKQDLVKAYEDASPKLDLPQIEAGIARHTLDFFYGINTSRALTLAIKKAAKRFAVLSAGRVQGPVLCMLAEKENEIQKFVPKPYWQLELKLDLKGQEAIAQHEQEKLWNEADAKKIFSSCKSKKAEVENVEKKNYKQSPPVPFNITSLQTEAYRFFGFSPQQTLSIAQELYTKAYCVTADTLIPLPSGEIITVKDFINKKISSTVGVDENLKTRKIKVQKWFKLPLSPLKKITLENGDSIKTTHDHKIMVMKEGNVTWIPASELTEEDYVAVPDMINVCRGNEYSCIFEIFNMFNEEDKNNIYIKFEKGFKDVLKQRLKNRKKKLSDISTYIKCKKNTVFKYSTNSIFPYSLIKYLINENILSEEDLESNIVSYSYLKKQIKLPFKIDENLSYFFGLVAADGHNDGRHISFPKIDKFKEVLDDFSKKIDVKISESKIQYYISSVLLCKMLEALDIPSGKKDDKIDISNLILKQQEKIVWSFITGFFDGDGSVKTKNTGSGKSKTVRVCFTSRSEKFISKLKLTLLTFGICSYVYRYPKHSTKDALDLLVYSDDFEKFYTGINNFCKIRADDLAEANKIYSISKSFRHSFKLIPLFGENLRKFVNDGGNIDLSNQLNHNKKIQKNLLVKIFSDSPYINSLGCGHLIWKKIKKIENVKPEETYDITTETHNFIANGIVVHNCSYPRTSSEKLPPQIGFREILQALAKSGKYEKICKHLLDLPELKPNEGKRIDPAHESIHPTVEPPKKILQPMQQKIYDLICRRFFAVFGKEALREAMKVSALLDGNRFVFTGRRTLEKGWMDLYGQYAKFDETVLPEMKKGDALDVKKLGMLSKQTAPPPRFSQASIIKEMETRELGTRATRAAILQTLYDRNYIQDKSLKVTDLGMKVADTLKKYVPDLVDEKLTRKFEKDLEKIMQEKIKKEKVLSQAKKALIQISSEFRENEDRIGKGLADAVMKTQDDRAVLGKCVKCDGELKVMFSPLTKKSFVGCTSYSRCAVCGFTKKACKCKCPICGGEKGKCACEWKQKIWTPKCSTGFPLPAMATIQKTDKICELCKTPIITVIRKGRRPFRMCLFPECPSKLEWGKKKDGKAKSAKKSRQIKTTKKKA